jgi:DNA repair protein RecO (recombination protein O)
MATIKDTAICVRHWDFSETSQTVGLFTREHGMVRGLAKGAKREKGEFSGGIDVLTRGEVVAIVKPGRNLATLTRWALDEIFPAVRTNLAANRAALYMADLVHHMLTDSDPHAAIFDALVDGLRCMENRQMVETALLRFQWEVLRETGYRPELHQDAVTGRPLPEGATTLAFSSSAGGVAADTGEPGRWRVRRDTIELLRAVERGELADDHPQPVAGVTRDVVDRANRLLAAHFRNLIGQEPASMRWAFSDLLPRAERADDR